MRSRTERKNTKKENMKERKKEGKKDRERNIVMVESRVICRFMVVHGWVNVPNV